LRETCAAASLYFWDILLCFDRQGYCARWRRPTPFARTKSGREPNEPRRRRPKVERIRKKYGAHPFARLSLASTRCLIEGAAGRFAGCRKKDRGRWKEGTEPEGQTALPSARGAAPFPIPKRAAQTLRRSGPLLRNAQPLEPLCASDRPSALIARGALTTPRSAHFRLIGS
jgi:hypothetical protein